MQLLNYILTAVVANIGIIMGIILAYIAKEEIEQGRNFFILMKNLIVGMIVAFIMKAYEFPILLIAVAFVMISSLMFYLDYKKIVTKKYDLIIRAILYAIFGIIFYLSQIRLAYFIIIALLIFLYGLPAGTLALNKKFTNKWKIILSSLTFLILAIVMYLI